MTEAQANVGVDLGAAVNPVEMAMDTPEEAPMLMRLLSRKSKSTLVRL